MRKIKKIKYAITPSLAGMTGWLFIVTIVMGVFFALPREVQIQTQNLTDEVLGEMVIVAPSQAAMEAEVALIKKHGEKENRLSSRIVIHSDRLFDPIIFQAANRHNVEPALVKAIIMAESGYNSKAISNKGARGLMQLMPATAEMLGVEDYYHPEDNINAGVKYFKQLLNQFDDDVELALAAYNAGSGRVREYQGVPPYKATHEYIKKVFEYYEFYKEQMSST
ncbi:MAG: lytic transglycosylase domain-containing protein [Deltaproteobacteria bacterium]|nr:lytic transglycosylase domain-containing protein [Deltaproteobacteria bacterium]